MGRIFHIDYETFSTRDLRKLGSFIYSEDPKAEIMIAAIAEELPTGLDGPYLYVAPKLDGSPRRTDPRANKMLDAAFSDPENELWAHNAQFESSLTVNCWLRQQPKLSQWRCTAALCRKAGLPASLEDAAIALGLKNKKIFEGYALIRKFCVPQVNKKTKEVSRIMPKDEPEAWEKFCNYCLQDVRTEADIYRVLKLIALRGDELRSFQQDMIMNHRGIPVNVKALEHAKKLLHEVYTKAADEFRKLTGLEYTQREKVLGWLKRRGVEVTDLKKKTLKVWMESGEIGPAPEIEDDDNEDVFEPGPETNEATRRAVEMYAQLGYAAPKKVMAMLNLASADARVRGTLLWYGAGTGRSSGVKMQPQNYKKPEFKDTALAFSMILGGCSVDDLEMLWGNALQVIASCIRHFIGFGDGTPLYDFDYNAIEARLVAGICGAKSLLDAFRSGKKLYEPMAAYIYDLPVEAIKNPSRERDVGKFSVLGCGYGMGPPRAQTQLQVQAGIKVDDATAKKMVFGYREMYPEVPAWWKEADAAMRDAIRSPGTRFPIGKLVCVRTQRLAGMSYMIVTLPSGRNLYYPQPQIEMVKKTVNGKERENESVTYFGRIKGKTWGRISIWGGALLENVCQATAGDLLNNGMFNLEDAGYAPFLPVHDQLLAPANYGSEEEFGRLFAALPAWAIEWLPIKAEGKIVPYYKK